MLKEKIDAKQHKTMKAEEKNESSNMLQNVGNLCTYLLDEGDAFP